MTTEVARGAFLSSRRVTGLSGIGIVFAFTVTRFGVPTTFRQWRTGRRLYRCLPSIAFIGVTGRSFSRFGIAATQVDATVTNRAFVILELVAQIPVAKAGLDIFVAAAIDPLGRCGQILGVGALVALLGSAENREIVEQDRLVALRRVVFATIGVAVGGIAFFLSHD